jgi:hypothetical protein
MSWEQITKEQVADMLLQIRAYGTKTEVARFNRLDFERKQKVTFVLRKRASRHKRDGENPYDYWTLKEVIEDAVNNIFINVNEDRVRR